MAIRRITVHLDPALAPHDVAAVDAASRLAAALKARLSVLVLSVPDAGDPALADIASVLDDATFEAARTRALSIAETAGADVEIAARPNQAYGIGEVLADHFRVSDLGIIATGPGASTGTRLMLTAAVFHGGGPVLVLPAGVAPDMPRRMVIGWDASAASARALRASMPLAALMDETFLVSVEGEKQTRLDRSAVEASRFIALHGAKATYRPVEGDRTDALGALMQAGADTGAGLVAVGAVRHSPIRDLILGGVTHALLSRPPARPVLMVA
jgi:nucleotide-binding universal stress UspA family protein